MRTNSKRRHKRSIRRNVFPWNFSWINIYNGYYSDNLLQTDFRRVRRQRTVQDNAECRYEPCRSKRSIHSQIMTVFFMPLIMAGIHVAFAFPIVKQILMMLNLTNTVCILFVLSYALLLLQLFMLLFILSQPKFIIIL